MTSGIFKRECEKCNAVFYTAIATLGACGDCTLMAFWEAMRLPPDEEFHGDIADGGERD